MFESLVITLREGVEAALVLAIALSLLRRRGLERRSGALFAGAGVAVLTSIGVAVLATRLTWNEELAEGIAMLVGSALVLTLVWWMWRSAPRMKEEIETGIERVTGGGASSLGLFLFAFGMVFREGVETAVFLSAAGFNSQGVGLWLGALIGLALAVVFGVLFVRGTLRVPLKPFFSLTSAVLLLIAVQLLIGGLHELSEAEVLPSSRAEMALIGPLVKNELLLFTLTVALAAAWLLFGPGRARPQPMTPAEGPEARLERAARERDTSRRRWTGILAVIVVGLLSVAFVRSSRLPAKEPAAALALENGEASFDIAPLQDGKMHFYQVVLPEGPVRFFALRTADRLVTCFDACSICGDKGYFLEGGSVVCRNCTSPIAIGSLQKGGGCNPIPLPARPDAGKLVVTAQDLRAELPHLKGR
jgi:high-affinity iron transporter